MATPLPIDVITELLRGYCGPHGCRCAGSRAGLPRRGTPQLLSLEAQLAAGLAACKHGRPKDRSWYREEAVRANRRLVKTTATPQQLKQEFDDILKCLKFCRIFDKFWSNSGQIPAIVRQI